MISSLKRILVASACGLVLLGLPAGLPEADAQTAVPTFPFFFPKIADCGTVGTVTSFLDLDGDGVLDTCPAWFADSGGAYLVAGIENLNVGDRVFVTGNVCTICLTTCPATAILNATLSECERKGGGGSK